MNSSDANSRHVLSGGIFQRLKRECVCAPECYFGAANVGLQAPAVSHLYPRAGVVFPASGLKKDRDQAIQRDIRGCAMRSKKKSSSDSFTAGWESKCGGFWKVGGFPRGFQEPSVKKSEPFPIPCFFPLTFSPSGSTLHHNICFLSPVSQPHPPLRWFFPTLVQKSCARTFKGYSGFSRIAK